MKSLKKKIELVHLNQRLGLLSYHNPFSEETSLFLLISFEYSHIKLKKLNFMIKSSIHAFVFYRNNTNK